MDLGIQNRSKIDQGGSMKSNEKKDARRRAKEAQTRGSNTVRPDGFEAWQAGRGKGKPFPKGLRTDLTALHHLRPKGWWDFLKSS